MARIVRFHQTGGPEVLRIEEVPPSPPGEGAVSYTHLTLPTIYSV